MSAATAHMHVIVNGAPRAYPSGTTVAALLEDLGSGPRGIAIAVNGDIVARSVWSSTVLRTGDRVEVLRAAQGGC